MPKISRRTRHISPAFRTIVYRYFSAVAMQREAKAMLRRMKRLTTPTRIAIAMMVYVFHDVARLYPWHGWQTEVLDRSRQIIKREWEDRVQSEALLDWHGGGVFHKVRGNMFKSAESPWVESRFSSDFTAQSAAHVTPVGAQAHHSQCNGVYPTESSSHCKLFIWGQASARGELSRSSGSIRLPASEVMSLSSARIFGWCPLAAAATALADGTSARFVLVEHSQTSVTLLNKSSVYTIAAPDWQQKSWDSKHTAEVKRKNILMLRLG